MERLSNPPPARKELSALTRDCPTRKPVLENRLSFAVTTHNETIDPGRRGKILQCIRGIQSHAHIAEIVVVDDCSEDFTDLERLLSGEPKVKLHHNKKNLGAFVNKIESIALCNSERIISCDSDNIMGHDFVDRVLSLEKRPNVRYCPSVGCPLFSYPELVGCYRMGSLPPPNKRSLFGSLLTKGNQVLHREAFMKAFGRSRGKVSGQVFADYPCAPNDVLEQTNNAPDAALSNFYWLLLGNELEVVDGLTYKHTYSGSTSGWHQGSAEKYRTVRRIMSCLYDGCPY